MVSRTPRRSLLALLAATLVVMALDVTGAPGPGILRAAGGVVFGPLERLVAGASTGTGATGPQAATDLVASRTTADLQAAQESATTSLATLRQASTTRGRTFVPAQVVAVGRLGATGPQRVTLDVGSRDGVTVDLGVVNAQGVVGRIVAVSPWTADVLLVGAPDLTIAVRVGSAGTIGAVDAVGSVGTVGSVRALGSVDRDETLGAVGAAGAGQGQEAGGSLELRPVQRGRVAVGDAVTTLGSLGGIPFPPGLRVGTVRHVVTPVGAVVPTAGVQPAVDVSSLDLVGVLLTHARTTPRPATTGG